MLLYEVSRQDISSAVVLDADPHLLQRSVHDEPGATLSPSTVGNKLLSKTAVIASILDCRSPSMVNKELAPMLATAEFEEKRPSPDGDHGFMKDCSQRQEC